jgi:predicted adenylyl cyclase CyaB
LFTDYLYIMGKELEIKISLNEDDLKMVESWLFTYADFIKEEDHLEIYLNNPGKSFKFINDEGVVDAADYLRIRKSGGEASMTLKNWHPNPEKPGQFTHCDETEFEVSDFDECLEMMKRLGFTDNSTMTKNRRKFVTKNKKFEIVIDELKELGMFMEVELKEDFEDPKEGFSRIKSLLKEIGFEKVQEFKRGYISMIWNPGKDWSITKTLT